MSTPVPPEPCTLAFAVLRAAEVPLSEILEALAAFGPPEAVCEAGSFGQSGYYAREMGPALERAYVALSAATDPGELATLKLAANALETRWTVEGRRRVNLDPGLVNLSQLVLASGKAAGHRVYLGLGIYAEVEYVFQSGSFRPLPWTYPDYREPRVVEFFNQIRRARKAARGGTG